MKGMQILLFFVSLIVQSCFLISKDAKTEFTKFAYIMNDPLVTSDGTILNYRDTAIMYFSQNYFIYALPVFQNLSDKSPNEIHQDTTTVRFNLGPTDSFVYNFVCGAISSSKCYFLDSFYLPVLRKSLSLDSINVARGFGTLDLSQLYTRTKRSDSILNRSKDELFLKFGKTIAEDEGDSIEIVLKKNFIGSFPCSISKGFDSLKLPFNLTSFKLIYLPKYSKEMGKSIPNHVLSMEISKQKIFADDKAVIDLLHKLENGTIKLK